MFASQTCWRRGQFRGRRLVEWAGCGGLSQHAFGMLLATRSVPRLAELTTWNTLMPYLAHLAEVYDIIGA